MRLKFAQKDALWLALAGSVAGSGAALLTKLGNPVDGGISIACFFRDIAGALGLHQVLEFSYLRPELTAMVIGAFLSAHLRGHFIPIGSSSAIARFCIGVVLAFGVFAYIGCPMRLGLRLAGGDPAGLAGLAGLIAGVYAGVWFLRNGFSLGTTVPAGRPTALLFHGIMVLVFVLLIARPSFLSLSQERHAPLAVALSIGLVVGMLGQQSKLCFIGGFRNAFLVGDVTLLVGFASLILSAAATNVALEQAHWGQHIIGSSDMLWSFLALAVVGLASVFLGGCPFRQLILASQGNTDAAIGILGIMVGAAVAYNYGCAFAAGSLDITGKAAVLAGLAGLVVFGFFNTRRA